MKYGREYARRPSGGGSWLLVFLVALGLLIGYGQSESIVLLRESIQEVWQQMNYEAALETLGRSFSGENGEPGAVAVFGQEILGFGTSE